MAVPDPVACACDSSLRRLRQENYKLMASLGKIGRSCQERERGTERRGYFLVHWSLCALPRVHGKKLCTLHSTPRGGEDKVSSVAHGFGEERDEWRTCPPFQLSRELHQARSDFLALGPDQDQLPR